MFNVLIVNILAPFKRVTKIENCFNFGINIVCIH